MERTYTLHEIDVVARELLLTFATPTADHAVLWGLSGDLGAGKTTLVQAIARALGVTETVTSPTFVLEKIYGLEGQRFEHLVHIDAYRFDAPEEISVLGWGELLAAPQNLILLEWPERVAALLPKDTHLFELSMVDEHTRRIVYAKSS